MADGYSQVFDDSGFVVLCFQRHKGLLDNLLCCVYCHSINTTFRLMACKRRKRKENDMGAIIMSVLVSVIAIVGVIYFNHQDKKEALKNNNKG